MNWDLTNTHLAQWNQSCLQLTLWLCVMSVLSWLIISWFIDISNISLAKDLSLWWNLRKRPRYKNLYCPRYLDKVRLWRVPLFLTLLRRTLGSFFLSEMHSVYIIWNCIITAWCNDILKICIILYLFAWYDTYDIKIYINLKMIRYNMSREIRWEHLVMKPFLEFYDPQTGRYGRNYILYTRLNVYIRLDIMYYLMCSIFKY